METPEIHVHESPWEHPYEIEELRHVGQVVSHRGRNKTFQAGAILRGLAEIFIVLDGACEAVLLDGSREFAIAEHHATYDFFMPMDLALDRDRISKAPDPSRKWRSVEATTCSVLDRLALSTLFSEDRAAFFVLHAAINMQWMRHEVRRLRELLISPNDESAIRTLLHYARFGIDGSIVVPVLIDNNAAPSAGPGGPMPEFYIAASDAPQGWSDFTVKHRVRPQNLFATVRMMRAAEHMWFSDEGLVFSAALCEWVRKRQRQTPDQ